MWRASDCFVGYVSNAHPYPPERAITVTHAATKLFEHIMAAYKASSKQWSAAFNKFAEVRMRGRKRSMIG